MGLDYKRFLGLSLSGPKNDKTSICALDFYPDQQKLMFSMLLTGIGADDDVSGDQWLLEIIKQQSKVELLAMDVPLQLPKCMRCELQCPGYENCQLAPIQWLWSNYNENKQKKRKTRIFAPYMERCVEYYLATQLEQDFHLPSSLGSNAAPLTARAHYLMKHIDSQCKEVSTALSIWRIGKRLSVPQKYLKYFPLSENADECRLEFLKALMKQDLVFIYNQDAQLMVENPQAFHAFICAYTMYLEFTGQCEKPPKDFPKDEVWLSFPKI